MKKNILLLILIFQNSFAQDITLKWGEKTPTKESVAILGGKNGLFYTLHNNKDNFLVGRTYDSELSLKDEKLINFNINSEKYIYKGAYILKDKILHFINETKRKEDKQFLYSCFSDFNLKTSDKLNIVNEAEDNDKIIGFGTASISPDSTKVLIYHEKFIQKNEPKRLVYKVYNSEITTVINVGEVSLPITAKNYTTQEIRVDNLGNVYVLAKIEKDKKEKQKKQSDYYFKLVVFAKNKEIKEFDFEYPDNDISSLSVMAGNNNTFFCTGFLSKVTVARETLIPNEMFFVTLDCNSLKLSDSKLLKIPSLYSALIKKYRDVKPYFIKKIYQKKDGGFSIVAEQFLYTEFFDYNRTTYFYEYGDIACLQTDSSMNVKSVTRIPKFQFNAINPSIVSTFVDNNTYVVYEDLTSNLDAKSDKETKVNLKSFKGKNSLFLLTINSSGEYKKEEIYSYKESAIMPYILGSKEIAPGEILLNADDQIGLLKIGK